MKSKLTTFALWESEFKLYILNLFLILSQKLVHKMSCFLKKFKIIKTIFEQNYFNG